MSSIADLLIISTLATRGIAMASLPMSIVACEFAATIAFFLILDTVKILALCSSWTPLKGTRDGWHAALAVLDRARNFMEEIGPKMSAENRLQAIYVQQGPAKRDAR
jgi:hypothetical protein